MKLSLDTEDRITRGLAALGAVTGLMANQAMSIGAEANGIAAMLELIHEDMTASLPSDLSRRLGVNDDDDG